MKKKTRYIPVKLLRKKLRHVMIEKILETLQFSAEMSVDLLDMFTSGYGESYRKARSGHHTEFKNDWAESYREAQRFYTYMNKLKREGFVTREKKGTFSLWKITKEGRTKWSALLKKKEYSTPEYQGEDDGVVRIVAFDVPERERHKRVWLQAALKSLEFTLLQKSVWMGTVRIPEVFLEDLQEKGMRGYVHIFEAGKRGTLEELN